jgi:hypothetical protein
MTAIMTKIPMSLTIHMRIDPRLVLRIHMETCHTGLTSVSAACSRPILAEPGSWARPESLRRGRDSNPRYRQAVQRLSRPPHSTTLPPLLITFRRCRSPNPPGIHGFSAQSFRALLIFSSIFLAISSHSSSFFSRSSFSRQSFISSRMLSLMSFRMWSHSSSQIGCLFFAFFFPTGFSIPTLQRTPSTKPKL